MATRNESHVRDLSTLANFKDWAMSIGAALTAFGWVQTTDTGQVNWGTIASVPTSNNYVYEIWKPGDAGTPFYIRLEYGNNGGSSPAIRISGGTGTNGAGTLTGFTTTVYRASSSGNGGATLRNCLYCGNTSCFVIMMWRDDISCLIAVDRSRNSSGTTTNDYFTVICKGAESITGGPGAVQSVLFGVGAAPVNAASTAMSTIAGASQQNTIGTTQSTVFNGNSPFFPVFPFIGYFDVPTLVVGHINKLDFTELSVLTTTILGGSHTYLYSNLSNMASGFNLGTLMLWE